MSDIDNPPVDEVIDDGSGHDPENDNPVDGADPPEEWTPPSKEDWEKTQRTVNARKADLAKLRKELGELKAKLPADQQDPPAGDAAKTDYETKLKRAAGQTALAAEGLTRDQAKLAVKLLDMSEVELDDDGDADFTDAIDALKTAFPALFAREAAGDQAKKDTRRPRTAAGNGSPPVRDRTAERLLRQAGFTV